MSAAMTPQELVGMLDEVFLAFDRLAEKHGVGKNKTIGDCYMVAAGVPHARADHAQVLARLALDMLELIAKASLRRPAPQFPYRDQFGSGRRRRHRTAEIHL
jgi:adenylate cyclase